MMIVCVPVSRFSANCSYFGKRNDDCLCACVQVYNVYEGRLLVHRKELHVRPITAITFFNPLKYLITGAMDGCSKC